jgi:hypothetical protein
MHNVHTRRALRRAFHDTVIDAPVYRAPAMAARPAYVRVSTFATATLKVGRWTFTTRAPFVVACLWLAARIGRVLGVLK